jgi:hypothetical protein
MHWEALQKYTADKAVPAALLPLSGNVLYLIGIEKKKLLDLVTGKKWRALDVELRPRKDTSIPHWEVNGVLLKKYNVDRPTTHCGGRPLRAGGVWGRLLMASGATQYLGLRTEGRVDQGGALRFTKMGSRICCCPSIILNPT